jgi:hypothetical protein
MQSCSQTLFPITSRTHARRICTLHQHRCPVGRPPAACMSHSARARLGLGTWRRWWQRRGHRSQWTSATTLIVLAYMRPAQAHSPIPKRCGVIKQVHGAEMCRCACGSSAARNTRCYFENRIVVLPTSHRSGIITTGRHVHHVWRDNASEVQTARRNSL